MVLLYYIGKKGVIFLNKSVFLISIGFVLIFIIQVMHFLSKLSGITFMKEGEVVSGPDIGITMYIIPALFLLFGFYFFIKERKL